MTNLSQYCGRVMQREGEREDGKRGNRGMITPHHIVYFKLLLSV